MFLNVLIDLILILILVIGSYYGYTHGLFLMLARPMRLVICIAFSFLLCRPIGEAFIKPLIHTPITSYISEMLYEKINAFSSEELVSELPTVLKIAFSLIGAPFDGELHITDKNADEVVSYIVEPLSNLLATLIAFVFLLIFARLLFGFALQGVNALLSIGIIGKLNRILGVVLSVTLAFLIAWSVAAGLDFLLRTNIAEGTPFRDDFNGGPIYRLLIEFSPVKLILSF